MENIKQTPDDKDYTYIVSVLPQDNKHSSFKFNHQNSLDPTSCQDETTPGWIVNTNLPMLESQRFIETCSGNFPTMSEMKTMKCGNLLRLINSQSNENLLRKSLIKIRKNS